MGFGDDQRTSTTAAAEQQPQQGRGIVQATKDAGHNAFGYVADAAHQTPKPIGMDEALHGRDHELRGAQAARAKDDAKFNAKEAAHDAGEAISQKAHELKEAASEKLGLDRGPAGDKAHDAKEHAKAAFHDAGDAASYKYDEAKDRANDAIERRRLESERANEGPTIGEKVGEWKDSALRAVGLKEESASDKAHDAKEHAKDAFHDAGDAASYKYDEAKDRANDAIERRHLESNQGPTIGEKVGEWKDSALRAVGLKEESASDKAHDAKEHAKDAFHDAGDAASYKYDEAKERANDAIERRRLESERANEGPTIGEKVGEWKDSALRAVGLKEETIGDKAHDAKEHAKDAFHDAGDAISRKAADAKDAIDRHRPHEKHESVPIELQQAREVQGRPFLERLRSPRAEDPVNLPSQEEARQQARQRASEDPAIRRQSMTDTELAADRIGEPPAASEPTLADKLGL